VRVIADDFEIAMARGRLGQRYGIRSTKGWMYVGTDEVDGAWWHTFVTETHPVLGRIREMIPASEGWDYAGPRTQRLWPTCMCCVPENLKG
jgi:hypothetical protein